MNIICRPDADTSRSFISVNCHVSKLIVNVDEENILFDFDDYEKMLDFVSKFVDKSKVNAIKEYISWNNDYIANLISNKKKANDKNNEQLSLF